MDFGGMLKKAQEMQQKMMEAKASLKNIQAEGIANNGAVKVILNGNHEMIKIDIDPKLMTEEKEVLEDLIQTFATGTKTFNCPAIFSITSTHLRKCQK